MYSLSCLQAFVTFIAQIIYLLGFGIYWLCKTVLNNLFMFLSGFPFLQTMHMLEEITGFLAACIAVYAFLLRFVPCFRKIDFYTTELNMDSHKGFQLFVIIENKSLASLALRKVTLIINDSFCAEICKFNNPFILKPFETTKIGTGYIHSMVGPNGETLTPMNFQGKHGLFLELYAKAKYQELWVDSIKSNKNLPCATLNRASFNGIPYNFAVMYAVQYYLGDKDFLTFVDNAGVCSKSIGKYNQIPIPQLINANSVKNYLENESEKWFGMKVCFHVTRLNEPLSDTILKIKSSSKKQ